MVVQSSNQINSDLPSSNTTDQAYGIDPITTAVSNSSVQYAITMVWQLQEALKVQVAETDLRQRR